MIIQYLVVNPVYELHRDEYLYLNQASHLSFGYICVPPFTALISKLIYLTGGGIFWVKFYPALFGALTIVFVWLIIEEAGGTTAAKILGGTAVLFSTLIRLNILFQPNSFDILIWTLAFYLLIKYVNTGEKRYIFLLAIAIAAGFYNKYNVIFLVAGIFSGLLLTKDRKILLRKEVWFSVIICVALLLPNIIWQIRNHFPVFEHMKVLKARQLDNNSASGFLISQLKFFAGSLPVIISALLAFIFYKPFYKYRFVGISWLVIIILFALMKAKDYYAAGAYPVLIALGSVYIAETCSTGIKRIVTPLFIAFNLVVFFAILNLVYPVLSPARIREKSELFKKIGLLRWEDGRDHNLPQDFADMLGWKEMSEKAYEAYKMIPADQLKSTLIICGNYGEAGAINYYNRKKMPEAYAFNTDYMYWMPVIPKIENILLVSSKPSDEITAMFSKVIQTGSIESSEAREKGTGIYLMTGANDKFTAVFYRLVEDRKKKLDIF